MKKLKDTIGGMNRMQKIGLALRAAGASLLGTALATTNIYIGVAGAVIGAIGEFIATLES